MSKTSKIILVVVSLLALVIVLLTFHGQKNSKPNEWQRKSLNIAGHEIDAYLADSGQKRTEGLAVFNQIDENQGMLFLFNTPGNHAFWMKDMKFAIDIVWIRDKKIVSINRNIQPEAGKSDSELAKYYPIGEVDNVLEVNAGWVEKNNIKIGDVVKID